MNMILEVCDVNVFLSINLVSRFLFFKLFIHLTIWKIFWANYSEPARGFSKSRCRFLFPNVINAMYSINIKSNISNINIFYNVHHKVDFNIIKHFYFKKYIGTQISVLKCIMFTYCSTVLYCRCYLISPKGQQSWGQDW